MDSRFIYDLRRDAEGTDSLSPALSALADRSLAAVRREADDLLDEYAAFVVDRGEAPRSRGEYVVELLTLGVAWRRYGAQARRAPALGVQVCRLLFRLRRVFPRAKPLVDRCRGWLASRVLLAGDEAAPVPRFDRRGLRRLILWLDASGEFKDEVKRLRLWQALAAHRGPAMLARLGETALSCEEGFAREAAVALGRFTAGVERFRGERQASAQDREDRIFCGKAEVEYHLSLLSSELTNRGLRESFERTPRKVVLLPACMRPVDRDCRAALVDGEPRCRACSGVCAIGRVTRLGLSAGFETRIIVHASSFTRSLLRYRDQTEQGVVAVACALNIVPGGYEMRELGIPSQCVLLDYPGCRRHWHPQGLATDLDDRRLLAVLAGTGPIATRMGSIVPIDRLAH